MFGRDERLIQFWLTLYPVLLFPPTDRKIKASVPPGVKEEWVCMNIDKPTWYQDKKTQLNYTITKQYPANWMIQPQPQSPGNVDKFGKNRTLPVVGTK